MNATSRVVSPLALATVLGTAISATASVGNLGFDGFADTSLLTINGDTVVDGQDLGVMLGN